MASPNEHLFQRFSPIDEVLKDVGVFLANKAVFEKVGGGTQKCKDKGLPRACDPLFEALSLDKEEWKYNVYRIHGANILQMTTDRFTVLIPVTVWGPNPSISSTQILSLAPGSITHITKDVEVKVEAGSVLDLFFMVKK